MSKSKGFRGYITSRPCGGLDFPQKVQNFLIRNYCEKHNLKFLLSATEYRMPGCYMIFEEVVGAIASLEGIVMFSLFMLPEKKASRMRIYETVLSAGKSLHMAHEDLSICKQEDIQRVEDILMLSNIALTDQSAEGLREFFAA